MAMHDRPRTRPLLIRCDRSTAERELLHIACCGSNEEHAAAMRHFLRRARLESVATHPPDAAPDHGVVPDDPTHPSHPLRENSMPATDKAADQ